MASLNVSDDDNWFLRCIHSKTGIYILLFYLVVWSLLLFPLYCLVLHTGFQKWQQNKRLTVSHTDFFTYHTFFFEVLIVSSHGIVISATLRSDFQLLRSGLHISMCGFLGLLLLQLLTCIERYLAVVYPLVYLSLRKQRWIRARDVIILVVWAFALGWMWGMKGLPTQSQSDASLCLLAAVASVITFCSIQVLRALRNPGPSEGRGVSQSKQKAFCTMLAILFVLMLWFTFAVVNYVLDISSLQVGVKCSFKMSGCWFELPSSLVLPLLYLHRAGKLPKCRSKEMKSPGLELRG